MKSQEKREEMNKIMKENFPELNVIFSYAVITSPKLDENSL